MSDFLADVGAALLEPVQQATALVAEAINKIGEGVVFTGEQLEVLALGIAALAAKVEQLQERANDATP